MESRLYAVFLLGAVFRAYRAIVAKRILSATIYLACFSALVSAIVYLMGAVQVAVMELSVGAGLLTVLLVYAVSVVGDDALDPASVIPKPLAFGLVGAVAVILGWIVFPAVQHGFSGISAELVTSLWHSRVLDVWIQRVRFLGVQPASVDIGKRSARRFCGLWLRLCRGLVQPWDFWRPPRFQPN